MSENKAIALFFALAAAVAAGYYLLVSKPDSERQKVDKIERKAARKEQALEQLKSGPRFIEWDLRNGAVVKVLRIPVPEGNYVDWATCFVYENKGTATMTCPREPSVGDLDWPDTEPDFTRGRP